MAGDAQLGVDARAVRRQLAVAVVARGGGHDIAPRGDAGVLRHEIVHAGRFRIRAVGLLDRDAVGQAPE